MKENQDKQSFVMYASFYDAAMGLNDEDFREYILALKDYALYGIEHTSQNTMVNGLLMMAQPLLEAAAKRREKQVKNGEYGILGGRPRKGETAEEYKARKAKTLKNPMGFQTETLNVNADADVKGKVDVEENRDVDLNVKENENWYENADVDVEDYANEETGIIKDTNIKRNRISKSTNILSSNLQKPASVKTKEGKEPRQEKSQHQVSSFNSKTEESCSKYGERPRQEKMQGSKESDFLRSITLDDDFDTPSTPTDERYRNYAETIQDYIRYDTEPNYEEMTDREMMDAAKDAVDDAILCGWREGRNQRFWDYLHRALKIYMHINGCSEDDAKRGINRLYKQREEILSDS